MHGTSLLMIGTASTQGTGGCRAAAAAVAVKAGPPSKTSPGSMRPTFAAVAVMLFSLVHVGLSHAAVSRVGAWTTGLTHTVGAGTDRLLVLVACLENSGSDNDISGVTYGSQAMTPVVEDFVEASGSRFSRCEIWSLDETGILAASGTAFVITYAGGAPAGETQAAITFQNVNQSSPIADTASNTSTTGATITTGAFSVAAGGMALSGAVHGGNGSYNDAAWGGAWTEGSDQGSGMTQGTAHVTNAYGVAGTDTATATHTASNNRQVLVAASLNPVAPYDFAKPITIDRGQISDASCGATLSDYPMLFSSTDPDLAHTGSGGDVTDLGGGDITFHGLDATTCGGPTTCTLDHEIEKYDNTTGELVAWVRIPSVNTSAAASDTVIYIFYGNDTIATPTENPTGVWDANHRGVWHLHDDLLDSTSNANDGTPTGTTNASPAEIADGQAFNGTSDYIQTPSTDLQTPDDFTLSLWLKANDTTSPSHLLWEGEGTANGWGVGLPGSEQEMHISIGDILPGTSGVTPDYLSFLLGDTDGGTFGTVDVLSVRTAFTDTTGWHQLAIVVSALSTAPQADLYFDGAFVMTDTGTTARTGRGTWDTALRFARPGLAERYFNGDLDEVRISDTARSSCWVGASHNNQAWPDKSETPSPDPSPNPSEGFYGIGAASATAVELMSFIAVGLDGAVELQWETATEMDNLGFHLYRSLSEAGPYERITAYLIPGLGSSPEGAQYGYRDVGLVNGVTYYYQLEDVETTGRTERHGPVSAMPRVGGEPPPDPADEDGASEDPTDDPTEDVGSWIRYGDPNATALTVLKRGKHHAELELRTGGFWALPDEDGSVWLQIPGFDDTQEPGAPALPVMRPWLEAVAGRKVKLVKVRGHDVVAFDGLRPAVTGEPEAWEREDGTLVPGVKRRGKGRGFNAAGLYPEAAAELLEIAFQGDVKKAQLALSPLRWDRSTGRLLLARRLTLRVKFSGRAKDELALGGAHGKKKRGKKGKKRLADSVLARLAVTAPGLYGVSYEELSAALGRKVNVSDLSLSHQGESVAFHVEPDGRRFGRGGMLYFVSAGAEQNPYGKQAVYELSLSDDGVRMPVAGAAPYGGAVSYYWARGQWEVDRLYQSSLLTSPERWLWDYVPFRQTKSYTFAVSAVAAGAEPARLEVWLQGSTDYPESPDHHIRLSVNGHEVGEARWDGKQPHKIEADVLPGVLLEGENTLAIENVPDTGAGYSMVILDRYALSYPRRLVASQGVLEGLFTHWGAGTAAVQGLHSAFILDTTQDIPSWLTGAFATPQGVSFRAESDHSYLAVSPEALLRPEVSVASPTTLRDTNNRADYVVLGPRAFLGAAEPRCCSSAAARAWRPWESRSRTSTPSSASARPVRRRCGTSSGTASTIGSSGRVTWCFWATPATTSRTTWARVSRTTCRRTSSGTATCGRFRTRPTRPSTATICCPTWRSGGCQRRASSRRRSSSRRC